MSPWLVFGLFLISAFRVISMDPPDDDDSDLQRVSSGVYSKCSTKIYFKNGRIKVRSRGRLAKFVCNQGFELVGKKFATCLLGNWDNPVPYCVARGCPSRESPPNGNVTPLNKGAILRYSCQPGYVLNGSPSVYCDGVKWNDSEPLCQPASSDPALSCDYESPDICGWSHDPSHDFDWKRHQFGTPSGHVGTGPSFDHTLGKGEAGFYMYTEASAPRKENDTARLFSPVYSPSLSPGCFNFWYHMYGVTIGIMKVYIKQEGQMFQEITPIWKLSGDQGNQWYQATIPLPSMHNNFQIILESLRGSNYVGDAAIDDVSLKQSNCSSMEDDNTTTADTTHSVKKDLDEEGDSGENATTPIMTTTQEESTESLAQTISVFPTTEPGTTTETITTVAETTFMTSNATLTEEATDATSTIPIIIQTTSESLQTISTAPTVTTANPTDETWTEEETLLTTTQQTTLPTTTTETIPETTAPTLFTTVKPEETTTPMEIHTTQENKTDTTETTTAKPQTISQEQQQKETVTATNTTWINESTTFLISTITSVKENETSQSETEKSWTPVTPTTSKQTPSTSTSTEATSSQKVFPSLGTKTSETRWKVRQTDQPPSTGFSRKETSKTKSENDKDYLALGLGCAAGVLVVGIVVGIGLYLALRKKGFKSQNSLADDSEMRYLRQNEMVEMINPSDA